MNYYVQYRPKRFACKIIMVFIESEKQIEEIAPQQSAMPEVEESEALASAQKLFSCEELERSIGLQLTGN